MTQAMKHIAFLGNWRVDYTTESHHAKSLEALGYTVHRLQESEVTADRVLASAKEADLFVWVHTHGWKTKGRSMTEVTAQLRSLGVPSLGYHLDLYLGLPGRLQRSREYIDSLDHFVTVDGPLAEQLGSRAIWLPPAVFHEECYAVEPTKQFDIGFVGSGNYHAEWPHRKQLLDHLQRRYGNRFRHYGGGTSRGIVRGHNLNQVYANAKIVVGDSFCPNYTYKSYWSDRVPETLGRNGFLLMPESPGISDWYRDREHLAYWPYGQFGKLDRLIDRYLDDPLEREQIRKRGHELVSSRDTYKHRWAEVMEMIGCQ